MRERERERWDEGRQGGGGDWSQSDRRSLSTCVEGEREGRKRGGWGRGNEGESEGEGVEGGEEERRREGVKKEGGRREEGGRVGGRRETEDGDYRSHRETGQVSDTLQPISVHKQTWVLDQQAVQSTSLHSKQCPWIQGSGPPSLATCVTNHHM